MQRSLKADLILLAVTLSWGMTFPLLKEAVVYVSPFVIVTSRFLIAGLLLLPFLWRDIKSSLKERTGADTAKRAFYYGLFIAALNAVVYVAQTKGMETVGSAEGAFVTSLNVILVPMLLPFFKLGRPKAKDFLCALICILGVFYLTGAKFHGVPVGVYWIILAAVFVALTIVAVQQATKSTKHIDTLVFYQIFLTGVLVGPFSIHDHYHNALHLTPLIAIGFCAIFATAFAILFQNRYQRFTTASRAALIFALEPVFATFFGYFINSEAITPHIIVGGGLILASIVVSEVL